MSTAVASSPPPPRPVVVSSAAGPNTDPWSEIVRLEYGADRSFAWSVREQILHSAPESREALEKKLLAALSTPGCTDAGKSALCELLALIGTAASVPALAKLLTEARSAEAARYALDRIPGPEASAALRDALPRLTGSAKAGLIGSLATRKDVLNQPAFAALRDNSSEPAIVREAAKRALERLSPAANR